MYLLLWYFRVLELCTSLQLVPMVLATHGCHQSPCAYRVGRKLDHYV